MNGFFWASGHLGWAIFSLLVFSGLWCLLADLVWRLKNMQIKRLACVMSAGGILGTGLIVLVYWLGHR
jgi:hypothetical protein